MPTTTAPVPTRPSPPVPPDPDSPRPLRWTREEYYQLAEAGFFRGRRVMLIEGEIIVMSPMNDPHARAIVFILQALPAAFGANFTYRPQLPLDIGQASDPEPDVAVIVGAPRSQPPGHPRTAVLVVEVSDTSLAFDIGDKANLYAAGGIGEYWVVDLVHNRLVVLRDPRPDPTATHGHSYFHHIFLGPGDVIAPLAAPNNSVNVADLFT